MIRKGPLEIADRAIFMLDGMGVSQEEIMRCTGISAMGYRNAIKRVESGRYGFWAPHAIKPGEGVRHGKH